jgi:secreted PhoX family phosphatase
MTVTRRSFLRTSATVTAGFLALRDFAGASGSDEVFQKYGRLMRDPEGILDLPEGFTYTVLSRTGELMDDGLYVPGYPDGMGAFPGPDGKVLVVCNHELESKGLTSLLHRGLGAFGKGNEKLGEVDRDKLYDAGGSGSRPSMGGTTTILYDPVARSQEKRFLSLIGTERNCAGGVTPWGTWISCEESTEDADGKYLKDHGYAFEVRPEAEAQLNDAVPLKEMGRFRREAVAVDPGTGIVYQTEDVKDGAFYRFLPTVPGQLSAGGRLEALVIVGEPERDTRNWGKSGAREFPVGNAVVVEWVALEDAESPEDDLRYQAQDKGAAIFARSEGIWRAEDGTIYFAATTGGREELGQIFKYSPSGGGGTLELFVEPNDKDICKNADNLTVAPWGDVILCEDYKGDAKIQGLTPDGRIYPFGVNVFNDSELAGVCFSPDGATMFVNIQKPGMTFAITGPWGAA